MRKKKRLDIRHLLANGEQLIAVIESCKQVYHPKATSVDVGRSYAVSWLVVRVLCVKILGPSKIFAAKVVLF